ncbi:hypothetical protein [Marinobacter sp. NFXS9]|uniref:hypothetical protein n=1 Tax=Marinobacter sp. NFXS9 TaxID=2818433 RepID=UPI0032DF937C
MTTTEAERQYYLSRMGVQLWYARIPLPGAAPSPDFDFTEPETAEGKSDSSAQGGLSLPTRDRPKEAPLPPGKSVKELLQSIDGGAKNGESATPPAKPATDEATSKAGPEPEASTHESVAESSPVSELEVDEASRVLAGVSVDMGIWWGDQFALVSPVSADVSEELQAKLAANILRAIGDTQVQQKRLVWPVFNNPRVLKSADRDLRMILHSLAEQVGQRKVVCLGSLSKEPEQHQALMAAMSETVVEAPDTLAGLAGDYEKKRSLWHQLQDRVIGAR